MIKLAQPTLGDEEREALRRVLDSGHLVQGPQVAAFEARIRERVGRAHGIAVSSGTAALYLALEALGVGPGDEVIVPALTWPSPAHAAAHRGAEVVLVDVDPAEWNVRGEAIRAARTERTRAIVAIDQFGVPLRAEELLEASEGIPLIEDAACALGSCFAPSPEADQGKPCGSLGLVSCFSFHPRKVLTTGEGGLCVCDEAALADTLRTLRNHGQREPGRFSAPGLNFRLSELGAALGSAQIGRLEAIVRRRAELRQIYEQALPGATLQASPPGSRPNHQTLGLLLPPGVGAAARDALIVRLRARGIEAGILSYALSRLGSLPSRAPMPVAEGIVDRGLALPLHPQMRDEDALTVAHALREEQP